MGSCVPELKLHLGPRLNLHKVHKVVHSHHLVMLSIKMPSVVSRQDDLATVESSGSMKQNWCSQRLSGGRRRTAGRSGAKAEACTNAAPRIDRKERFWNFKKAKPIPHLQKGVRTVKNFIESGILVISPKWLLW